MTWISEPARVPAAGALRAAPKHGARLLALVLVLSGCSLTPPASPFGVADPADAEAPAAPLTDTGVLGNYVSARPVAPRSWREQNERVAPGRQP